MRFSKFAIAAVSAAATSSIALTSAMASTVTVQPGDSLWKISQRNHVSVQALRSANPSVNPSNLLVGTVIHLPGKPAVTSTSAYTYKVRPHDTLWKISRRIGVSVKTLQTLNPNASVKNLQVGTVLRLQSDKHINSTVPTKKVNPVTDRVSTISGQNLYWMEHIIHAEADGEPLQAQIAVGDVVLHRLQSGNCGATVKDVVFQISDGHYQFTPVANGYIYTNPTATNVQAAIAVLQKGTDVVPGAYVFYNPAETPSGSWVRLQPTITKIGDFIFAK